jgi:HSP20 family protein
MFDSLYNFPDEFERLRQEFDDLFGAVGMPTGIRSVARGAFPAINVGNTPQSLEIYAFAPGVDASKVEVTVDRGVLTLAGERPSAVPEGKGKVNVYSRERVGGAFRRAISLPDDADPSKVEATYSDGVLHISIARREAAQPKRIAIQ